MEDWGLKTQAKRHGLVILLETVGMPGHVLSLDCFPPVGEYHVNKNVMKCQFILPNIASVFFDPENIFGISENK